MTAWTGVIEGVPSKEVVVPIENCEAAGGMTSDGDEQNVAFFVEGLGFGARCAFVVCVGWWLGVVSKLFHFCVVVAASWKGIPFQTRTAAVPKLSLPSLKTYQL